MGNKVSAQMLIDHAAIDFGEFAGRLFLLKDESGTRLEVE
jgi:hypothetical protein